MFSAWAPTLISRVLFTFWFYIKTGKPPTHPIHPLAGLAPVHRHGGSEVLVDLEGLPHKARSRLEMLPVMEDIVICHDDIGRSSYLKYRIGTINIELLCRAWCDSFCKIILLNKFILAVSRGPWVHDISQRTLNVISTLRGCKRKQRFKKNEYYWTFDWRSHAVWIYPYASG